MFSLDIFLTNLLDFTKTIIPLALMASWAIDSEPIRARGIIVKYSTRAREIFVRYLPPKHKMMPCYHAYLLSVFICTVQVIKYQCIPQQHAKHCGTNNTNAFPNQTLSRMRRWWMDVFLISDVGYQIECSFFMSNAVTR